MDYDLDINNGDDKIEVSGSVVGASQSEVGLESQTEGKQDEVFVWPWIGVIVNIPVELRNGIYVGELKQEMTQCKTDWREKKSHGSQLYGWVARDDDRHSGGVVGKYLCKSNLKTINEIMDEDERKTSQLVSSLSNVISEKEKNINVMKFKVQETSSSLHKVMEEKEKLVNIYNEEITNMQLHTQNHLKMIFHEHEKWRLQLESQRNELEVCGRELKMREVQSESERRKLTDEKIKNSRRNESLQMADMAQKIADENVLRLVEAQKHIGSEDLDVLKKMKVMTENLEEKEEELEDLKDIQAALKAKEQKSNAELEEAREELIKDYATIKLMVACYLILARIGLKNIGHLDIKPFRDACKRKYFGKEADEKAIELCSLWDGYLRNPEWHPYKVVKVEGGDQANFPDSVKLFPVKLVLVNDQDEKLKDLKNELGGDVYDAVATALLEIKDYNPRESLHQTVCVTVALVTLPNSMIWILMDRNLDEISYEKETEIHADIDVTSEEMKNGTHKLEVSDEFIVTAVAASQPDVCVDSQTERMQDEVFVWPGWVSLLIFQSNGKMEKRQGKVHRKFSKDWAGFGNAISFEKSFEADHLGQMDWLATERHGSKLYGWITQEDDYYSGDVLGKNLHKFGDLKTIKHIEDERKTDQLVSKLSNAII
ncbi:hypothetical protein IFM89_030191 [Coptis chinensis]|uniref:Factor of DNA methylation 1-5/IDN2 domain-containing protein n=1 Tax=Coptis chinensis TaxID=261450 RepID=A0A835GYR0_9MAGN|nr:hypothetical protein IFM89_030191 [Coptis chinensis]